MRFSKVYFCIIIMMMSLMVSLSSSSFFLSKYLDQKLIASDHRAEQFSYALKHNHVVALTIAAEKSELGSVAWLKFNKALANHDKEAALQLGHWYQEKSQNEANSPLTSIAVMWFKQAIRLKSNHAVVSLAQLYFQRGEVGQAQVLLNQLPSLILDEEPAESAFILRIKIAIYLGDVMLVEQLLTSEAFKLYGQASIQQLIASMIDYQVIENKSLLSDLMVNYAYFPTTPESYENCLISLQLFATNLNHLDHLAHLIETFKTKQPLADYVCLPKPRYISRTLLNCDAVDNQPIICDESVWLNKIDDLNTRHIGLMVEEGGANVHYGILYFDAKDDVDVFSHELSHLLGFVDEYPLREKHDKCQGAQQPFSHNIAVLNQYYYGDRQQLRSSILKKVPWAHSIKMSTPILQKVEGRDDVEGIWILGTPVEFVDVVGMHIAETCQNSSALSNNTKRKTSTKDRSDDYSAYKPISRRTQLRYYAEDFPSEYLTMLQTAPKAYLMPSFHYNIALALYQQGKVTEARYWLQQASGWEVNGVKR